MTIIEGLRAYLLANATIAAAVTSSSLGVQVFPLRLRQKTDLENGIGAIVLTRISDVGEAHLRGPNALSRARIQVDCWARTHDTATALGSLVRQRIDGYAGDWTDAASPQETLRVQAITSDMESDHFEEEINGGLCRHSADYFVFSASVSEEILI